MNSSTPFVVRAGDYGATTDRGRFAEHMRSTDDVSLPPQLAQAMAPKPRVSLASAAAAYARNTPPEPDPVEVPLDTASLAANPDAYFSEVAVDGKYLAVYSQVQQVFAVAGGNDHMWWQVKQGSADVAAAVWANRHDINTAVNAAGHRQQTFAVELDGEHIVLRDTARPDRAPLLLPAAASTGA